MMIRSKLTSFVCLAAAFAPGRVGLAEELAATESSDDSASVWLLKPESGVRPAPATTQIDRHKQRAEALLMGEPIAATSASDAELPRNADALWELVAGKNAVAKSMAPPPPVDSGHRFQILGTDETVKVDDSPEEPLWNLGVDDPNRVPLLTTDVFRATNKNLEIRPSISGDAQPFSTQEPSTSIADVSTDAVNDESSPAEPGAPETKPGELAIPMVESIDLHDIRLAALQNNKAINVFRFQQEEVATGIDTALSVFDPNLGINFLGGERYAQNRDLIQSFGAVTPIQDSYFLGPYEQNQIYLKKKNYLGGQALVGVTSDYQDLDPAGVGVFVNPGWQSRLRFQYQQSLLKGFGKQVNTAPIYIAARQADQSAFTFQASVHQLMRDIELAYWDWELAVALQKVLEQNEELSRQLAVKEAEKLKIGTGTVASDAEARERFLRSRISLIQGMSLATLGEFNLRQVAGLPPTDGIAFVPGESPNENRPFDDLYLAIGHSVHRPEVQAQRAAIAAANAGTVIARNGLKPDLSVIADYSMLGLEERFDDSFHTLGDARFYEWTVGIRYTQPLYWRAEQAAVRKADWAVAKQQAVMDQLQHVIAHQVASAYQVVEASAAQLEAQKERIRIAETEFEARTELYDANRGQVEDLFDSQDRMLQSRTDYQVTLTNHQKAITNLRYASGMILDDQFVFQDDPATVPAATEEPANAEEPQEAEADVDEIPAT